MLLQKAIEGFLINKSAEGLSPNTLSSYRSHLACWMEWAKNPAVEKITTDDLRAYLVWLRTSYKPRRFNGKDSPLASKSLRNAWVTLSAFYTWASSELGIPHALKPVKAPPFEESPIEPFTKPDIEALLKACDYCEPANATRRSSFTMRRPTAKRDRAIILMLLDTGLRASELCALTVGDVEQKSGKVRVKHGPAGGAKAGKGRTVYLGRAASRTLWRYLVGRGDGDDPSAPLFQGKLERPLKRDTLRQLCVSLGKKAGVSHCYPHCFRHTFAITYLRAGGDVFTLQMLLGHSDLTMVRRYARIAEIDVENAHRRASPADAWRL
jgi:integrase/recombinase XerD